MRTFLIWSWTLNLLLLACILFTATNIETRTGMLAFSWVIFNTALQYAAEPSHGRK